MIVVCSGGGIPVVATDGSAAMRGVEAVMDTDLTAALLGRQLDADALLLLTDVPAVQDGYGRPHGRRSAALPRPSSGPRLPARLDGPKIEAACRFTEGQAVRYRPAR